MKKIFLIYGHYDDKSFNAAIRDTFMKTAKDRGHFVDVFRPSKEALDIAKDTINIGAKVLWLQLGIRNEEARSLVESKNIQYIENKCTKMEYQKYFLKMRQAFPVLQD